MADSKYEPWRELGMKLAIMPQMSKASATARLLVAGWNEELINENWEKASAFAKSSRIAEQQKRESVRRRLHKEKKDPSDAFDEMAAAAQGHLASIASSASVSRK